MNINAEELIAHHARLVQARETFLLNHKASFIAVAQSTTALMHMTEQVAQQSRHDVNLRDSLAVALSIMRRSACSAFEALAQHEAHVAWFSVRPTIEAALVMGKWMDHFPHFSLWASPRTTKQLRTAYNKHFSGPGLISTCLPHSHVLRSALSAINTLFSHWNVDHLKRTAELREEPGHPGHIFVRWGASNDMITPHAYAFVHILAVVVEGTARMLTPKWIPAETDLSVLRHVEANFKDGVLKCAEQDPAAVEILVNLGGWPQKAFSTRKGNLSDR